MGPDFTADFTSGTTLGVWSDPASGSVPSRINPRPELPHRRFNGTVAIQIEVTATVGGVAGELDVNLGGRLFQADLIEFPGVKPALTSPAGQSSVQRFTASSAGHYTLVMLRDEGGVVVMHVDVT